MNAENHGETLCVCFSIKENKRKESQTSQHYKPDLPFQAYTTDLLLILLCGVVKGELAVGYGQLCGTDPLSPPCGLKG